MKELLEAGVHFGHQTKRWNPKMKKFIFGKRNGIYIIDLQKMLKQFKEASKFVTELAAQGKNLLFVGTKRQAQDAIYEEANRCGMFYVHTRWLGGTLTNFSTIRKSIHRLKEIEGVLAQEDNENLTKKERLRLEREKEKLGVLIRIELDTFFRPRESEHRLVQTFETPVGNGDPFSQINRTPRGTLHQRAEHCLRVNRQLLLWNRADDVLNRLGHGPRLQTSTAGLIRQSCH